MVSEIRRCARRIREGEFYSCGLPNGTLQGNPRWRFILRREQNMAVNKPVGDSARKGAVRKRTQLKTKIEGKAHWTSSRTSGQFLDQKKRPTAKRFKGVRREKAS
jgi:hypothetical protein